MIELTPGELPISAPFEYPASNNDPTGLTAWDKGPEGHDASGTTAWDFIWELKYADDHLQLERIDAPATLRVLKKIKKVKKVALTFDQSARYVFAYEVDKKTYLNWYDSLIGSRVLTEFDGRAPCLVMDQKYHYANVLNINTIYLFYYRNGKVWYRSQNDRYGVEYEIGDAGFLRKVGVCVDYRIRIDTYKKRPVNEEV